jgi:hypothetical protein
MEEDVFRQITNAPEVWWNSGLFAAHMLRKVNSILVSWLFFAGEYTFVCSLSGFHLPKVARTTSTRCGPTRWAVRGCCFVLPGSHCFAVSKIGGDWLEDWAARSGMTHWPCAGHRYDSTDSLRSSFRH